MEEALVGVEEFFGSIFPGGIPAILLCFLGLVLVVCRVAEEGFEVLCKGGKVEVIGAGRMGENLAYAALVG